MGRLYRLYLWGCHQVRYLNLQKLFDRKIGQAKIRFELQDRRSRSVARAPGHVKCYSIKRFDHNRYKELFRKQHPKVDFAKYFQLV